MTTTGATPTILPAIESAGFGRLLRAEWTKLRTVSAWVIALLLAGAVIVGLGLLPGMRGTCTDGACVLPVGPEGEEVTDSFSFLHQSLTGDGTITVRVTSLTGVLPSEPGSPDDPASGGPAAGPAAGHGRPGVVDWAKAGLIIKAGTQTGSAYAAVMVTGAHGVRMQHNFTHDTAGQAGAVTGASPRWLRLTRTGDVITGAESPDGSAWTTVAVVRLAGLPATVEAGMFATSPQYAAPISEGFGIAGAQGGPTEATATFDRLDQRGSWPTPTWSSDRIGGPDNAPQRPRGVLDPGEGEFTLTGSGDIAPAVSGPAGIGLTISQTLVGTFVGLILIVVVAAMFITAEYRRDLISTTVAASPRRGRVLAAKATVVGGVTFVVGLVAAAIVVTFGQSVLRGNGVYVHPASTATELRVIAGTAALLAVAAVLAVALGTVLRRGVVAVTTAIVVIVLPYLLAISVLPASAGAWLLRVTPAAAFAVQQTSHQYEQVANIYTPAAGFFPLPGWAGFAVLVAWTVAALGLATYLLRRRDV